MMTLVLLLVASLAAKAADEVSVSGSLKNSSSKNVVLAFYGGYEATRAFPGCKSISIPDGQFDTSFKVKQRLYFMQGSQFQGKIPSQFGLCGYTLNKAGVVVVDPAMAQNMLKMGADEVEEGVFEFRGAVSDLIPVKGGSKSVNTLNCKMEDGYIAKCDFSEVVSNGSSLKLSINVQ